jgi:hypothetical protein
MKNIKIIWIEISLLLLLIINISEVFGQEYKNHDEFVSKKASEYLLLLSDSPKYFTIEGHWTEYVLKLYELVLENNIPILRWIDYVNGEKIIFQTIQLAEQSLPEWTPNNVTLILRFGYRNRSKYTDWVGLMHDYIEFTEKNNEVSIRLVVGGTTCRQLPTNNISELLPKYFDYRRKTQIQFTGKYEFERIEIISDIRNFEITFSTFEEIFITDTESGNLFIYFNNDITNKGIFYINNNEVAKFFSSAAEGGGIGRDSYYYFEDDFLIYYYFSFRNYDGGDGTDDYNIFYKVYYKKRQTAHNKR